jgi:hypothetical protein
MTDFNLYVLSWVISFALALLVVAGLWLLGECLYHKWWMWLFRRQLMRHLRRKRHLL